MMLSFIFAVVAFSIGAYFWLTMFPTTELFAIASMGDLLVFASIVMWGCFTVFGKKITGELGALTVTAAVTLIGAAWMAPVGWIEIQRTGFSLAGITPVASGNRRVGIRIEFDRRI